jgi:hypothetical protein
MKPKCDLCNLREAKYDASLINMGGTWAYVCEECFVEYGCRLGVGCGTRLKKEETK